MNQLNTLIPALIGGFTKSPQQVTEAFGQIINAMLKVKIIDLKDVDRLILGEKISEDAKESKKFVITRLEVMIDNLIDQVTNEDEFDFVSKVLLELSE